MATREPLGLLVAGGARRRRRRRRGLWIGAGAVLLVGLLLATRGLWAGPVRAELAEVRIARLAGPLRAAAAEFALDPYLLAGLVFAESSGRLDVVSSAEALGLCQLKLETARERARVLGLPEPSRAQLLRSAELNLRLGAAYLAYLRERQDGHLERALMAYNTGPTRFDRWLREAGGYAAWRAAVDAEGPPGPTSVRTYAAKVQAAAERFRESALLGPEP
jgi:soluble lytic murein transglycosylase-like protein